MKPVSIFTKFLHHGVDRSELSPEEQEEYDAKIKPHKQSDKIKFRGVKSVPLQPGYYSEGVGDHVYKLERLRTLWYKPGVIETRKTKVRNQTNPKEHTTFGHKRRTRVESTLGSSAIQSDPQKYIKH